MLTTIDSYAFSNTSLTTIIIPASVTSIGDYAFSNISTLTTLTFLNTTTTISFGGSNVFSGSSNVSVIIDSNNTALLATFKSLFPGIPVVSNYTCFLEGSKMLTDKGYVKIEELNKGDNVKISLDVYKKIEMIGWREIYHVNTQDRIKNQLYKCTKENYPELLEDLIITGCHSILIENVKDEGVKERILKVLGDIYVTGNKYRLPVCADDRAVIYEKKGVYKVYHVALESDNYYDNYGIYANGLLVESCSKRYLKELSGMTLK
jgi:hypothetical protein